MKKLLLASHNQGKVREITALLSPLGYQVSPQSAFNVSEVAETGLTFVENALIKARHASQITGLPSLADDSGLAVDALGGEPGIYSARYAGENASDQDNIQRLIEKMQDIPQQQRQARFICVLVFLLHSEDPTPIICQGEWQGSISLSPSGQQGFGYDPIFWVPETQCHAAQLSAEHKNRLSHRGKALAELLKQLKQRQLHS
jgi:XTP/dITP diphosphohydrolase